ncbi:MAG: hypothetical protein F4X66_16340 [Chloroflexi bacterium]|nr:hypothetical protein [Chloroflexota bacterium]MYE41245.1 hypothetical protein [Chloroflexota bacterium]
MTSNPPNPQHHHALTGLARCESCRLPMSAISEPETSYICPNRIRGGPDDCPTPPTDARTLDEAAVMYLVSHLTANPGFRKVASQAKQDADKVKEAQKATEERASNELGNQNRERLHLLEEVEMERTTYTEATGRLNELNDLRSGLQADIGECREESERQDFICDERRLRDAAWNMDTYLDSTEPEAVQQLLESFIKEVLVRPGTATIRYTVPMPPLAPSGGVNEDVISLEPPASLE